MAETAFDRKRPSGKSLVFTAIAFLSLVALIYAFYSMIAMDVAEYQKSAEATQQALESNAQNLRILGLERADERADGDTQF